MSGAGGMAGPGVRHVFIRNLVLPVSIGVYDNEQGGAQRVRINVDLAVTDEGDGDDRLSRVVDYGRVFDQVKAIVAGGHIKLVETFAERIAAACLSDTRILRVRVRVEKLDVFAEAESAGIELERRQIDSAR